MARIAGVDLPREKRVAIGLTYIFGIGKKISNDILSSANIDKNIKTSELTDEDVSTIRQLIEDNYFLSNDLTKTIWSTCQGSNQKNIINYMATIQSARIFNTRK